jgi:hypothetical protein
MMVLLAAVLFTQVETLDGPIRPTEVKAFKAMAAKSAPAPNNVGNVWCYGVPGNTLDGLAIMFQATGDLEILDRMVYFADAALAARNSPDTGRIMWTGKRELCWWNRDAANSEAKYSGTENGYIVGHIATVAKLILQRPELQGTVVPSGDPHGFGKTYGERARTYVTELAKTVDTFLYPNLIRPADKRMYWPDSPQFGAIGSRYQQQRNTSIPWNQQMMLNAGFQRLAECFEILGGAQDKVDQYDAVVKASMDWFFTKVTKYQAQGHDVYKWGYGTEGGVEDIDHLPHDIVGFYRAYQRPKYGVTREAMQTFANTIRYVVYKGGSNFAGKVDGTGAAYNYIYSRVLHLGEFDPEAFKIMAAADQGKAKSNIDYAARILWVRQVLSGGVAVRPHVRKTTGFGSQITSNHFDAAGRRREKGRVWSIVPITAGEP